MDIHTYTHIYAVVLALTSRETEAADLRRWRSLQILISSSQACVLLTLFKMLACFGYG